MFYFAKIFQFASKETSHRATEKSQRKEERHNFKKPFAPFVCFAVLYPPRILKKSVEETSPVSSENLGIARQPKALLPDEKENTGIAGLCRGFLTSFGGKSSVMART
ncbi:hypothetical protein [Anaeromusa acidaminophila]|uniref:hypothetical protein n=1 Tax=Anaeromusa acidaminophila TaxID=81464 RepID=UPI00047649C6|nr:hypothetical protein [Anaeromusa acidaminophila]